MTRGKGKKQPRKGNRSTQQQQPNPNPQPPVGPGIVGVVESARSEPPKPPESQGEGGQADGGKKPRRWQVWFAAVELALATAIMVFTGVQAYFGWGQWEAMIAQNNVATRQLDQTDEMLQNAREARRARLFVRGITARSLEVGKPMVATVVIENSGEVPAKITEYSGAQRFSGDYRPMIIMHLLAADEGQEEIGIIVPPKGTAELFVSSETQLTQEDFNLLTGGPPTADRDRVVEGIISYTDTLKSTGKLTWAWVYKPDLNAFVQDDYGNDFE